MLIPRLRSHSLLAVLCVCICVGSAQAVESTDNSPRVRELVKTGQRHLSQFDQALDNYEYDLARTTGSAAGDPLGSNRTPTRSMVNSREVEREADRIGSVGNDISQIAAKCGKDGKRIGADFRQSTQRLRGTVRRLVTANSVAMAQMSISKARMDAQMVANALGLVLQIQGCVPDEDKNADPEEEAPEQDSEAQPAEQPEEPPGN
ncbi:MAG: hypothetical protein HC872_02670 [Gammaproteobacteria bacterium]|nr:hypothetical protein [Gammaproteobacteria bacterium]